MEFKIRDGSVWRELKDSTEVEVARVVCEGDCRVMVDQANSMEKIIEVVDNHMFVTNHKRGKG